MGMVNLAARQIVPQLADEGTGLASESAFQQDRGIFMHNQFLIQQ